MITCPNCQHPNRSGAFYCKNCGHAIACPRCRIILDDPGHYCDNCGQPLATTPETVLAIRESAENFPAAIISLEAEQLDQESQPQETKSTAVPSNLDQFVPQALRRKLEAIQSSGRMVGERRIVTMLFCDVKGSTAAAEQLDPEEWTEIINGAFEFMIKPVYKYEGTVARLMGDAILAFFGAPIAHEDDPQRAVLAGLDIVAGLAPYREKIERQWNIDINVRVGINTGTVVVGAVGTDLRMEYTAMGDAVNLASRMEQAAEPGTVQIAAETYKLVTPFFEVEELGPIQVKGKTEPVPAYRVLHRRADITRQRHIGGASLPLTGRAEEVQKMDKAMDEVQGGNGQILFITGEIGLGKSRLIDELHRAWDKTFSPPPNGQDGHGLQTYPRWFETFSLSYESALPYSLFHHFLRQVIGATQADPPGVLASKVSEFAQAALIAADREQAVAVMETLFGLDEKGKNALEGEVFKSRFYAAITSMISQWAERSPGVLVTDDLQWADPASLDLLGHLFELSDSLPILFVCTLRPDRSSPAWQLLDHADHHYPHRFTEIRLEPLSSSESQELIMQMLDNRKLPDALVGGIMAKAAGNPYFIEEVVRALIDHGALIPSASGEGWEMNPDISWKDIAIPDSLQSTIMARIDRLDEAQKNTLQMAALIGQSFYYRVLKQLVQLLDGSSASANDELNQNLGDLQRLEFIVQVARMPELEYVFRQALVQESAYKTILHKQRREYHLKVGEAMETLFPDQLEKHALVLAHHFSEAGAYDRALKYHIMAGENAFRLYAAAEAVEHYSQALRAAEKVMQDKGSTAETIVDSEILTQIYSRLGRALELNARVKDAVANYEAMREKARQISDPKMELAALMAMATQFSIPSPVYDFKRAETASNEALQLAQELNDRPAEAKILWNYSNMHRFSGNLDEALASGEKALAIAREMDLPEQVAYSLNDLAHMYNRTGLHAKTKAALQETISLWRELKNLPMLADSLSTAAYVHTFTGDFEEAVGYGDEALEISKSIANTWGRSYSQWVIGRVFWEQGDPGHALRVMNDSIQFAEKSGFMVAKAYTRADLALVFGQLGDFDQAFQTTAAAKQAVANRLNLFEPYILAHEARLYMLQGDYQKCAEILEKLSHIKGPIYLNRPQVITIVECELPFHLGRVNESLKLFKKRRAALKKFGLKMFVPETLFLSGRTLIAAGRQEEAHDALAEGLQAAHSLGSRWPEWQILLEMANIVSDDQAVSLRAQALQIIIAIAENIPEPDLRTSFLTRPDIQKVTGGQTELQALKNFATAWLVDY